MTGKAAYIDISHIPREELKTGDKVKYLPEGEVKAVEYWFKLNGGSCYLYDREEDIGKDGMARWQPSKGKVDPWRRKVSANGESSSGSKSKPEADKMDTTEIMDTHYCLTRLNEISIREDELARERKELISRLLALNTKGSELPPTLPVLPVKEKEKEKDKKKKQTQ